MSYRIKPELVEAISEIERRLDEFRKLDQHDLVGELQTILGRLFCHLDSETLPFVDVRSWYAEQLRGVGQLGGGALRWPKAVADRFTTQLRLLFLVTTHRGALQAFCLAFVPDSEIRKANVKGCVRVLLRPLTVTFREFIESDEAQVEQYVATVVSYETGRESTTQLTEIELKRLRSARNRFEHFVDCVAEPAQAECIRSGKRVSQALTDGQAELFVAAFTESRNGFFDPVKLATTATVETSRAQTFKTMRATIDTKVAGEFRLFQSRKQQHSRKSEYRFEPDEGVSWCVVLRLGE